MKLETNLGMGQSPTVNMRLFLLSIVCLLFIPVSAFAGGKQDLADGIAFYENLDTDRAMKKLTSATNDKSLDVKDRAKAFMFIGVIHFELGESEKSKKAWASCFSLDIKAAPPEGISPEMLEAITVARISAKTGATTPPVASSASPEQGGVTKPADKPDLPEVKATPPKAEDEASGGPVNIFGPDFDWVLWGSVGGGVALAAIVTVVAIALATPANECSEDTGGCIVVNFK
ncbi:MAG: hypothetical protein VYC39_17060 [Myxococcota bacterium]|nr:hypothetical protein [Myxococcota bacterium]